VNLEVVNALAQLIAALGVIVSLSLAVQIRQNTMTTIVLPPPLPERLGGEVIQAPDWRTRKAALRSEIK
jgi:hypothetical protein